MSKSEIKRIEVLLREQTAKEIEDRCRDIHQVDEWVGYPIIIVCNDCQDICEYIRRKK